MRRAAAAACIALGTAAVLAGVAVAAGSTTDGSAVGARRVSVVDVGRLPSAPHAAPTHHTHGSVPRGAHLLFDGVDAAISRVRAQAGVMQIPRDPRRVGWWSGGAAPGDPAGTVVVVGHVNYAGVTGALSAITRLRPGDRVTVREPSQTIRYRVVAMRTYPKSTGIPTDAFASGGPARLALITCGGPFDPSTGNYLDNIVAYAVPG